MKNLDGGDGGREGEDAARGEERRRKHQPLEEQATSSPVTYVEAVCLSDVIYLSATRKTEPIHRTHARTRLSYSCYSDATLSTNYLPSKFVFIFSSNFLVRRRLYLLSIDIFNFYALVDVLVLFIFVKRCSGATFLFTFHFYSSYVSRFIFTFYRYFQLLFTSRNFSS